MIFMITSDSVGANSGGGKVTKQEAAALISISHGRFGFISPIEVCPHPKTVWEHDEIAAECVRMMAYPIELAHFYAGTYTETIKALHARGAKVTYTCAAHDVEASRKEHELLGVPYDYPHLTDPEQWKRYVQGYLDADVLIVPSKHSMETMRKYGATQRIEIIPHGHLWLAENNPRTPERFTVGYLGAIGPDKGLRVLLQAWKLLSYQDADLVIAGPLSQSPFADYMVATYGGGSIRQIGYVERLGDFYQSLSLYVQPSVSEGFGIEVLEALAGNVPVISSDGCGASDLNHPSMVFPSGDVKILAGMIDAQRKMKALPYLKPLIPPVVEFTWDRIRDRYVKLWKEIL